MKKEYIIWGVPEGNKEKIEALREEVLYTQAKSLKQAEDVMKQLREKHGCTDVRLQTIDLSVPLLNLTKLIFNYFKSVLQVLMFLIKPN